MPRCAAVSDERPGRPAPALRRDRRGGHERPARSWPARSAPRSRAPTARHVALRSTACARAGIDRRRRPRRGQRAGRATTSSSSCSTAIPADNPERAAARARGLPELHRAELLAELTGASASIAVAGTHGKTTTTVDDRPRAAGRRPRPGLPHRRRAARRRARTPPGGRASGSSSRPTSPTARCLRLTPEIAVVTNVELDHHATYGSRAELDDAFRAFLRRPPARGRLGPPRAARAGRARRADVRRPRRGPAPRAAPRFALATGREVRAGRPGRPQRPATPPPRSRRCAARGRRRGRGGRGARRPSGAPGRRFEGLGTHRRGRARRRRLRAPPDRGRGDDRGGAHAARRGAWSRSSSRTSSRARALLAREFGAALAGADVAALLDVYPARERAEDFPGASGLTLAEAAADAAGGRPVLWLPTFDDAERCLRGRAARRATCCSSSAPGDVDALGRRLVASAARPSRGAERADQAGRATGRAQAGVRVEARVAMPPSLALPRQRSPRRACAPPRLRVVLVAARRRRPAGRRLAVAARLVARRRPRTSRSRARAGPSAPGSPRALEAAARDMTTLHVRTRPSCARSVEPFPQSSQDVSADALDLPHRPAHRRHRAPAGRGVSSSPARASPSPPTARSCAAPVDRRCRSSPVPARRRRRRARRPPRAGARRAPGRGARRAARQRRARRRGAHGPRAPLRDGPVLVFGAADRAAREVGRRGRACSATGSSAGATYLDVRLPERPAAGGLSAAPPSGARQSIRSPSTSATGGP